VTALGIGQTSNSSFTVPLTILPGSSANGIFNINNPVGCAPMSTDFQNLLPSNGHAGYSYSWDFGNGNQSSLENPPVQYYNTPGDYVVHLQTTIDTLGYFLSSLSVLGATSGCDDSPFSSPDYYFVLLDGTNTVYTSAYIDNTDAPVTFSFSPIALNNSSYTIQVYDYDDGLAGGDDHCNSDVYFNGYWPGTHTLTSSGLTVSITIDHPIINQSATDTVHVYPLLQVGNMSILPNDSVCAGDSITLSIPAISGCTYQWYRDTAAIFNATSNNYTTSLAGEYYCEVTNIYGCRAYSAYKTLHFMPNPPKPTFWITGNTLNTLLAGYHLQWYLNYVAISGANALTYHFATSGNYFVIASSAFGCATSSDTVYATYVTGINESEEPISYRLFPNPNNGSFVVEFELTDEKEISISATDLVGKSVYEEDMGMQNGLVHKDIELKTAAKGIYMVNIKAGNSIIHQRVSVY
jgi:hypothetical protein